MLKEIEGLVAEAEGVPMDLNLSNIHSIAGRPDVEAAPVATHP